RLISAIAPKNSERRFKENLHVEPQRLLTDITKIHADHVIKRRAAPPANLPDARQTRSRFQDPSSMPEGIALEFIRDRRSWSYERHIAPKDVEKLRQLVKAAFAKYSADARDAWVILNLIRAVGPIQFLGYELPNVFLVDARITVHVHRAKLQESEFLSCLS